MLVDAWEKNICIRPMKPDEIPTCVRIIRESFVTVADAFGITQENAPRFTAFATNDERLSWQFFQEKRSMIVADAGTCGGLVGYYSLHKVSEIACELNNLAVLPSARHHGIGGMLLSDACQQAMKWGCGKIQIGIVEENILLRKWYEKAGFVHVGTEKLSFFPFTCGYLEKVL